MAESLWLTAIRLAQVRANEGAICENVEAVLTANKTVRSRRKTEPDPDQIRLRSSDRMSILAPRLLDQEPPPPSQPVTDLVAGIAAEHIVCADLLLDGWRAFLTDQYCPYDLAVEVDGRLVRLQVKATRSSRPTPQRSRHVPAYMWHVRRAGKGGARTYGADEFDMLALVALDIRRIAYLPPSCKLQTVHIRPPGAEGGRQFDDFSFPRAVEEMAA